MTNFRWRLGLALLTTSGFAQAIDESLESVSSRGVEQRFILSRPDGAPTAALLLFAGGHGKLSLGSMFGRPSIGWGKDNNLVRTRKGYAKQGFLVATIDGPADRKKINAWKNDTEHLFAQRCARSKWYRSYQVQVVEVLREHRASLATG